MAHWAEIDENNIVLRVTVGSNDDPDEGYQWLIDNLGGTWLKTSYNTFGGVHATGGTPFRKNFASIGFSYDPVRDAFIPPTPYPSWIFDDELNEWLAPIEKPKFDIENPSYYVWNEQLLNWEQISE